MNCLLSSKKMNDIDRKRNWVYMKKHDPDEYKNWKDYYNEKFNCPCGGRYTRGHIEQHYKTKKHTDYMKNQ